MTLPFERYATGSADLLAEIERLVADLDPTTPVPGCPEWDAAELRDHVAGVAAFWTQQLRRADPSADGPDFPDEIRDRYRRPLPELAAELAAELSAAGPDRGCWNWSGNDLHSGWVARRMANEFAVHAADAQATAGASVSVDADLAADGIDELIDVFASPKPDKQWTSGGVVHLDPGDGPGWTIEISTDGNARRSDTAPDATIEGRVDQLLLALWGRPADVVEEGDPAPMRLWHEN